MNPQTRQVRPLAVCLRLLLTLVVVCVAERVASAQVQNLTIPASHDNTLYEDAFGTVSNGVGEHFFVGKNGGGVIRRAVLRFELSAIPPGATITNVTLSLYMSRTRAGSSTVSLHRLTSSWGEGASSGGGEEGLGDPARPNDATWIHRYFDTTFWVMPGGDFVGAPSASASVGGIGTYTWSSAGMVADMQNWVNDGATNFGWLLKGNEATFPTAKRFESRQNSVVSRRPSLQITYNGPPPLTGACCLPTGACTVVNSAVCLSQSGVYQGHGASCSPNPCPPPPTGACCLPSGACVVETFLNCAAMNGVYQGDNASCSPNPCPPGLTPFVDALPIPPIALPASGVAGGAAHYDIAVRRFQQSLHRDLPATTVYGYAGTYPGPTIEARAGQPVTVRWINDLRGESEQWLEAHDLAVDPCLHGPDVHGGVPRIVTHLHGGHVPAASDGYPDEAFPPGDESPLYTYPNAQRAATLWYHDHALGLTRLNVYMGLAGCYLLRDATEEAFNLPRGSFEIPLIIQDRSFHQDGRLKYNEEWHEHFFGEFILVNGKVWPYLNVAQGKYRFRIVNGSNGRAYTLSLSNSRPLTLIGNDGGLLGFPSSLPSITILPGERADVVIDFAGLVAGTQVILQNSAPAPFPGQAGVGVVPNVMKFIVTNDPGDTDALPATLSPVVPIAASAALRDRPLVLRKLSVECAPGGLMDMWTINDLMWDDIVERPRLGTTEIWSWINRSNESHPMHMHLVHFQVLDRQDFQVVNEQIVPIGGRMLPPPGDLGWKDTVNATPGQITRVIARFEGYTGLFPYHCHVLEHEDNEMMRQFLARPVCLGDANDDGLVNFGDVTAVLANFGASGPKGIQGDANLNGFVDFGDVTTVLGSFGLSCQ